MDREATSFITPILDFTSRSEMFGGEYISPQQRNDAKWCLVPIMME